MPLLNVEVTTKVCHNTHYFCEVMFTTMNVTTLTSRSLQNVKLVSIVTEHFTTNFLQCVAVQFIGQKLLNTSLTYP